MEVVIILLLIVVLFSINSIKKSINEKIEKLEKEVIQLRTSLKSTAQGISPLTEKSPEAKPVIETAKDYWKSGFGVEKAEEQKLPAEAEPERAALKKDENLTRPVPIAAITKIPEPATPKPPVAFKPPKPGFFERNPDLEKFIGENLVSKIGIAILVLAIGFFVKYAIDNEWIGTIGRVAIGLACGGILVAIAHRLQKSYHAFSSVLVGGGLAVFYFTIALAYHEYHLFGSTATFIIMLVITAFAVALSLLYNRQEVAIIALVGGFASPFLASSGSGNYVALFIYLIILNTGLLIIAYYKAWRWLNLLAFIFTCILFWAWLGTLPDVTAPSIYRSAFVFATIFYVLFFAINIANNIKENKKFIGSDFGILLSNTALYFSVGLYCLSQTNATEYNGLFSASTGVFNLAASWILLRNRKTDPNILYLLIGITLTFISLTAPLQLRGSHITLFWASEAVLLYWLFQKSAIKILQLSTVIIYAAMLVSLAMDLSTVYLYNNASLPVIFNKGFITTVYCGVSSLAIYYLVNKTNNTQASAYLLKAKNYFKLIAFALLYGAGLFEIIFQFRHHYPATLVYVAYVQVYTFAFVLLLLSLKNSITRLPPVIQAGLLSACVILYLLFISDTYSLQATVLTLQTLRAQFIITQVLIALLAAVIFLKLAHFVAPTNGKNFFKSPVYVWVLCAAVIIFVSTEAHLLVNHVFYSAQTSLSDISRIFNKTGLAILWGLSSFAFMWLGMEYKFRSLRIISLTLFSLTLAKLFLFDIRNIPVAGKIAAFFCLGILLLVISFMYQRLKKIIIEDEKSLQKQ